jgi:hypothetical protein
MFKRRVCKRTKKKRMYVIIPIARSLPLEKIKTEKEVVVFEVNKEDRPSENTQSCNFEETQRDQHAHQKLDAVLIWPPPPW